MDKAQEFLYELSKKLPFGYQVYEECKGRIFECGHFKRIDKHTTSADFINDFNPKTLNSLFNRVLKSYS